MANVLDCNLVMRLSLSDKNPREKYRPSHLLAIGEVVPLLFFYKDGFGID